MKTFAFWLLLAAVAAACGGNKRVYGEGGSDDSRGGDGPTGEGGDSGDETREGAAGQSNGEAGAPAFPPCRKGRDGEPCGKRTCASAFGECTADDVCAVEGERSRSCTDWVCEAGVCEAVEVTEKEPCQRDTDGTPCGDRTCPDWGACSYDSTCSEGGSRTRTCSDHVCDAGACEPVAVEETDTSACDRDTDGSSCGTTDCGSCSYANSCDETAQKWCTEYLCGGGACKENGFYATYACPTRDVCEPGAKLSCIFWDTDFCGPGQDGACTGQKTCNSSCGWSATCVRVSGGCAC